MLSLELTDKELKDLNYDYNAIINLLVSRAIYNESVNYDFSEESKMQMKYIYDCEFVKFYMSKTVEPRVVVNENTVIDEYNKNKQYFVSNNISFKDARDMIISNLNYQMNYDLEQDLMKLLIDNMNDTITLNKEDVKFSKGDPEVIKSLLVISLLKEETNKNDFKTKYESELDTINKNVQLNFFINEYNRQGISVTEDEIKEIYEQNKEKLNDTYENTYNDIIHSLYNHKLNENITEYTNSIIEKYNLNEYAKQYIKDEENI